MDHLSVVELVVWMLFSPFEYQNPLGKADSTDVSSAYIERNGDLGSSRWVEDLINIPMGWI